MTLLKISQLPDEMVFTSEAEFRKHAKKKLEDAGFEVDAISVPHKLKSQLSGLGDLHVRRKEWERGKFIKIEVKLGPRCDWSSPKQEQDYFDGEFELFLWDGDVSEFIKRNKSTTAR